MRLLVTGAAGFLGRHVVERALAGGHDVRALVRPATDAARLDWGDRVELHRGDLRADAGLADALGGIDAVVHLAATTAGDEDEAFVSGVVGTERLLAAMEKRGTRRIVLASSITVYDWTRASGVLTEDSPLEASIYTRGGYTVAKVWQERLVERMAEGGLLDATVLRPGFIWGNGNDYVAGAGIAAGPMDVVFGRRTLLPLTYVENCADCFVAALDADAAVGEVFNVVDDEGVAAARYLAIRARAAGRQPRLVSVPYPIARAVVRAVDGIARGVLGERRKLPSLFYPARFDARFKPLRFSREKLRARIGWEPPIAWDEAVRRTFQFEP